ncbi:MAG: hypothetical protein J5J06_10245 [Phycisphaerae bacterium]|nr:hypothetical protein [Phycisphaerae bacterium]
MVDHRGDLDATEVYYYEGWKIVEIRDGSDDMDRQFIHGTQYIDEHVMMRAAGKGDLYIHQGERSRRERAAIGKAGRDARVTCPELRRVRPLTHHSSPDQRIRPPRIGSRNQPGQPIRPLLPARDFSTNSMRH